MARKNRSEIIDKQEVQVLHIVDRCVRRSFLCGEDISTNRSFDYRRQWLRDRLVMLVGYFRIDLLGFGIMGNHMHLLVRSRPDLIEAMRDEEVIRAWWEISPSYRRNGRAGNLTSKRLERLLSDQIHVASCRERLASISWFMRYLKHPIAIRANLDDGRSGHFWESRFRSKKIESQSQLLNSLVYIDLNPIRAGMATSVHDAIYTSAYERTRNLARRRRLLTSASHQAQHELRQYAKQTQVIAETDQWLAPIPIDTDACKTVDEDHELCADLQQEHSIKRRVPDRGILPISEHKYLLLVDFACRFQASVNGIDSRSEELAILRQLGIRSARSWMKAYSRFTEQLSLMYSRKVNSLDESVLVRIPLKNPEKTNQDGFL